jgi:transcriptional regulator with XRE-family HTH domain
MVNLEIFRERLKEQIKEKNINQSILARETGISNQAISNWILGKGEPLVSYVWRLADYFDCSMDYLLGRTDY